MAILGSLQVVVVVVIVAILIIPDYFAVNLRIKYSIIS